MVHCLKANWRKRSRGFLWDWAEGEPEDDLTKNYPFPVPRIRDLSSVLRTELHPEPKSNDPAPLPNVTIESDADSDYTSSDTRKGGQKKFIRRSSDSKLLKPARHDHVYYSLNCNSRRYRGVSRRYSSYRYKSFVKSIVEEPPDASQLEIAHAREKLFHKSQHIEV